MQSLGASLKGTNPLLLLFAKNRSTVFVWFTWVAIFISISYLNTSHNPTRKVPALDRKAFTAFIIVINLTSLVIMNSPRVTGAQSVASQSLMSSGTINQLSLIGRGVNYNPRRMYDVTNETLNRDFSRFQKDGINVISLSLYWYRLEGNRRGDYNGYLADGIPYGDPFLNHVKRFIEIADQYKLKVIVSFHTGWKETGNEWFTPDYVVDDTGSNTHVVVVKDENFKQAFLDMVNHTVTYLKNEHIFAWGLLNEPWGIQYTESFINLIQRESALVKLITGKPVTVRFVCSNTWTSTVDGKNYMSNHFIQLWNWDQRIFDSLDFISLNTYIKYPELYDTWLNITRDDVNGIIQRGKSVFITEFGFQSDDDVLQAYYYKKTLDALDTMKISGWQAWSWEQYDLHDLGKSWNILKDAQGTPRPAYDEMVKHFPQGS